MRTIWLSAAASLRLSERIGKGDCFFLLMESIFVAAFNTTTQPLGEHMHAGVP